MPPKVISLPISLPFTEFSFKINSPNVLIFTVTRFSEFQIYLFGSTEDGGGLVLNVNLGNVLA